jgi:hypothetical protein
VNAEHWPNAGETKMKILNLIPTTLALITCSALLGASGYAAPQVDPDAAWNNYKKGDLEQAYNLLKGVSDTCTKQTGINSWDAKPKLDLAINFLKRGVADRYPDVNKVISQINTVDPNSKNLDGVYYCEKVRQILDPQLKTLHDTWSKVIKAKDDLELKSKVGDAQKAIDIDKSNSDKLASYQKSTGVYLQQQQQYQAQLDLLKKQHEKDLQSKNTCTAAAPEGNGSGLASATKLDETPASATTLTGKIPAGSFAGGKK